MNVKTDAQKWKLVKYNVRSGKSSILLNDIGEFGVSVSEDKIIYESSLDNKVYLYDMKIQESVLLAKYREYLLDNSIQFSSGGDLAFYVEKTYGAIDRESMHKFFVVDLKTNRVRMIKDWKREASFYGISW